MDERRWANLESVRASYEAGRVDSRTAPLEAFFEVAARCNLHCQMCAINYDRRYLPGSPRPPFLTPELFGRLRPIFPTLLRAYLFGLGEPLLNRNLVDYVAELSAAGSEVWFNTNGTLIDEEKAEALARAGATAITVSIDGATPDTYERIRVGARYSDVLRGIRALVATSRRHGRPRVDLSFVAMASNLHELPRLVDLAAAEGVGGVHVEPLYSQIQHDLQEHYASEHLGLLPVEEVDALFIEGRRRAETAGVRLASRFLSDRGGSADYVQKARNLPIWWTCSEPWTSIWVTSAGEVRTCCINETSFGNVFEKTFEEVWNGGAYAAFRDQHRDRASTPTGCGNCIRNGRVRHSPFLSPLESVTYRPIVRPDSPANRHAGSSATLQEPVDGGVVTDPLVVAGDISERGPLPDLVLDRGFSLPLEPHAVRDSGRYAATLDLPYLTEGAHLLSLRDRSGTLFAERTVHVWRPDAEANRTRAISTLALRLASPPPRWRCVVRIDGRPWSRVTHLRQGEAGITLLDVGDLAPGPHRVTVGAGWPGQAVSYEILKLARDSACRL